MILLELFWSFCKIGFTSFGGLSMVPLINSEMLSHGWMTLSEVSDIVAIRENGAVSCYYCDSICFQELPGLIPENYLKNAEMQLEDDYGMIDGVVNNGAKDRKEKAAKDKAEKPSVVEQLKNQPHCEVRKKSTVKYTEQER